MWALHSRWANCWRLYHLTPFSTRFIPSKLQVGDNKLIIPYSSSSSSFSLLFVMRWYFAGLNLSLQLSTDFNWHCLSRKGFQWAAKIKLIWQANDRKRTRWKVSCETRYFMRLHIGFKQKKRGHILCLAFAITRRSTLPSADAHCLIANTKLNV